MKLNCLIIDDEPVARKILEEYIADTSFLELAGKAGNPVEAAAILNQQKIDLLFLDINMPKMTGMQFLQSTTSLPMTILTTAYTEYAVEGYSFDVIDYLVKPFSFDRFLKACYKAKEKYELQSKQADHFFVKVDGRFEKVMYDDLLYAEAMQNYVMLHTTNGKLLAYITLKNAEEQLPSNFIKIHKSVIVNTDKIKSINGNTIDLGYAQVQISQGLQDTVIKEILKDKLMKR